MEREDLLRQVSRELQAAARTHREREERERIEQAAAPAIKPWKTKAKSGSSRKAKKGRGNQRKAKFNR